MIMANNEHYLGNPNLKAKGVDVEFTKEQVAEYLRCGQDPLYFIKKYVKIVHLDRGLIPFEQSWSGGTAFFEHEYEKVPEIVYGSHPNRLILFDGRRNHAACHDFRTEKRYYLNCFMDI